MVNLKAIHSIWNKKNPITPGTSFNCNDQREVDHLVRSGAAVIVETIVDPLPSLPPATPLPSNTAESTDKSDSTDTTVNDDELADAESENLTDDNGQAEMSTGAIVDIEESDSTFKIAGIDSSVVKLLVAAGIDSIERAKQLTKEQLVAVPGLGYNNAQKVFKALK
jgi:hypothetical protein